MTKKILDYLVAMTLALPLLLGSGAVVAQDTKVASTNGADVLGIGGLTPEGLWEAEDRTSRYKVTLCGDGTQLCAELVWIKRWARNDRNVQYLNKYVVFEAERFLPVEWRGDIDIYGTIYGGSVKIKSYERVTVTGCILILCESFDLIRKRNPDGSRYLSPAA